jgi:steroid 5-alpha reductase family enzyme
VVSSAEATAIVAAAQAGTIAVGMVLTAWWSSRVRRFLVIDAAWGAAFLAAALIGSAVAGAADAHGEPWRRWLVTALVVVWGARLTRHLLGRVSAGSSDDPRYEEMLGGSFDEVPWRRVVVRVFVLQGVAILLVAAPVVAGQTTSARWPWVVVPGVALWLVGLLFEAVGDAQLAAYRRDPDRGPVLDRGLWAWTRHPNYFGDACVWWGIWIAGALAAGPVAAAATVIAPLVMTWLLTVVSGARLAERRMAGRPGWAEYAARTSMFVPWPPRR